MRPEANEVGKISPASSKLHDCEWTIGIWQPLTQKRLKDVKVKNRLLALTNSRVIDPSAKQPAGSTRPTLKRRKEGEDPNQTDKTEETQQKDRPTLKRRDSDPKPPSGN